MALLEVKNLKKNFGSTEVLKDINFDLEEGQAISIIGSCIFSRTICSSFFVHLTFAIL